MTAGSWSFLLTRTRAMHALWQRALQDMTVEQVNHQERAGVLNITFSLYHFVNGEDLNVASRLRDGTTIWNEDWAKRTGIEAEAIRRGTPISVAEKVRMRDLDAWREYQSQVFARTEETLASTPADRWNEVVFPSVPDNLKGGFIGLIAGDGPVYLGDLMDAFLYQHGMRHIGEIEHARSLVGLTGLS